MNKFDIVNFASENNNIKTSTYSYKKYQKWIPYGQDNLLPNKLKSISNQSVTHSAALSFIQKCVTNKFEEGTVSNAIKAFFDANESKLTGKILNKIVQQVVLFEGFALEVIWNKAGNKILEIHVLPFENIRAGIPDEYGTISNYLYFADICKTNSYETINIYNPETAKEDQKQIYYVYLESFSQDFYPLPSYSSSYNQISAEHEIGVHYNAVTNNGFNASSLITFIGEPTPEEKNINKQMFENNFRGPENSGKFIIAYTSDVSQKPIIEAINVNPNICDIYESVSNSCKNAILASHNILCPELLGVEQNSMFASGEELKAKFSVFQKTKIADYQNFITENLNYLFKTGGVDASANLKLTQYNIFE